MKKLLEQYLKNLTDTTRRGDAREESYYKHLDSLIKQVALIQSIKKVDVTILPKKTEAGNPEAEKELIDAEERISPCQK